MTTSNELRDLANNADAFAPPRRHTPAPFTYTGLAIVYRLAAQMLDADAAGDFTLAERPEVTALVELARRLHTR